MKKWIKIFVWPLLFIVACSKAPMDENDYRVFTIKKGGHNSLNSIQSFKDSVLRFNVLFDSTAIYACENKDNQMDVNKLFGISDCGYDHHVNSARIGWRWLNDSLQLLAYVYHNKERRIHYLTSCAIGKDVQCSITAAGDHYLFRVDETFYREDRACSGHQHYILHPYFGGDEVAPHDITIRINYDLKT